MPGPKPPAVNLDEASRDALQQLLKQRTAQQQLVLRARVVLLADAGLNDCQIARRLGLTPKSVGVWRHRWLQYAHVPLPQMSVQERLADAPRSGAPPTFSPEALCQIIALACEPPSESGRPITHWTNRELADEAKARGIVESISPRHVGRTLKRCGPAAAQKPLLAHARA
jgi:transposase